MINVLLKHVKNLVQLMNKHVKLIPKIVYLIIYWINVNLQFSHVNQLIIKWLVNKLWLLNKVDSVYGLMKFVLQPLAIWLKLKEAKIYVILLVKIVNMIILVVVKIKHLINVNHLDLELHVLQIHLEMLVFGIKFRKSASNLINVKISY